MNTFTFLTFTRPLAIPSDVFAALLKHSFTFVSHFIAEEGYSILTENVLTKSFFKSVTTILFLISFYCLVSIVVFPLRHVTNGSTSLLNEKNVMYVCNEGN